MFIPKGLSIIKNNPSILYSVFLLIFIPFAIYYITLSTTESLQKNIDDSLQKIMLFTGGLISNIITNDLLNNDYSSLQNKIQELKENNERVKNLRVIVKEGDFFKVVGSFDKNEVGNFIKGNPITLAFENGVSYAYQTNIPGQTIEGEGESLKESNFFELIFSNYEKERFWDIVYPIKQDNNTIGLLSFSISVGDIDKAMLNSISRAYLITLIIIIFSIFLIIHHAFLFKYPIMLKKLQEVDQMKDEFIRMAIHEIQSPITNLRGYVEFIKDNMKGELTDEKIKENMVALDILDKSAKRLSDLVSDLLEVARIEQGRVKFNMVPLTPSAVAYEVVGELSKKAKDKGLEIIFQDNAFGRKIIASESHLKEVFYNLIDNAIKYTMKGNIKVLLESDESKGKYIITIQDTGIGISAQDQKRLFEKFFRVRSKETAEIPGTGLGLWIVKNLVEKMGGKIFLESIKGVGTRITIVFDIVKDESSNKKA